MTQLELDLMKPPLMMPSYLCGECGIEMLLDHDAGARAAERVITARCFTPRCLQKDQRVTLALQPASVTAEAPTTT